MSDSPDAATILTQALGRRLNQARRNGISGGKLITGLITHNTDGDHPNQPEVSAEHPEVSTAEVVEAVEVPEVVEVLKVEVVEPITAEVLDIPETPKVETPKVETPKQTNTPLSRSCVTRRPITTQPTVTSEYRVNKPRVRSPSCFMCCYPGMAPAITSVGHIVIDFGDADAAEDDQDMVQDLIYIDDLFESDTPFCYGLGIRFTQLFR